MMRKSIFLLCLLLLTLGLLCACGDRCAHTLTHHPAAAATCADGNAEYWSCEDCGKYFADEKGSVEIADKATVVLAATGEHSYNFEHICEICGDKLTVSDGLIYILSNDGSTYTVAGGVPGSTALVIPATYEGKPVTAIAERAFYNYNKLTAITIPESVTVIGSSAFTGCSALTAVHITDLGVWCTVDFADSAANPLVYAKRLYLNGAPAEDLTVPAGVTEIADYAFYNCASLKSITLPESVTRIGKSAFYACSYMTACTVPAGLTEIGNSAFYFCRSLASITVPATVTAIGAEAFVNCTSLAGAYFGETAGWVIATDHTAIPPEQLTDPATAVLLLRETYVNAAWSRTMD